MSNPSTQIIIPQNETLIESIKRLEACKIIGTLIVVENEDNLKVVGMLSGGDIRRWLLENHNNEKLSELITTTPVKDVIKENKVVTVSKSDLVSWFFQIEEARGENREHRIRIVPIVENGCLVGILDLVATKDRSRLDAILMEMAYPIKEEGGPNWLTVEEIKKRREDYDAHRIESQIKKYSALAQLDKREMLAMIEKNRIDGLYTAFERGSDWAKKFPSPNDLFKDTLTTLANDLNHAKNSLLLLYLAGKLLEPNQPYLEPGEQNKKNILCVLGCATPNEQVARVEEAVRILQYLIEDREIIPGAVVLSGGGRNGNKTEAVIMKKLIEKKIKKNDKIKNFFNDKKPILEEDSLDTVGNAVFSTLRLLQAKVLVLDNDKKTFSTPDGEEVRILVITSDYHAPRALNLFARIFKPEQIKICMSSTVTDIQKNVERAEKQFDSEFKANSDTFALENVLTGLSNSIADGEVFSIFFQLLQKHDLYQDREDLVRKYKAVIQKWVGKVA